jgi:hypothetical protein
VSKGNPLTVFVAMEKFNLTLQDDVQGIWRPPLCYDGFTHCILLARQNFCKLDTLFGRQVAKEVDMIKKISWLGVHHG